MALAAAPAVGQVLGPDFTSDELKCQSGSATVFAKQLAARAKCITKCYQGVRKGEIPSTDCTPPAFGGGTAACILDATKGADAKALATLAKLCAKDCPECYAGGDCNARGVQAVSTAALVSDTQLLPVIYCGTQSGLSPTQAKCQDAAAKQATKLAGSLAKCTAKCKAAEAASKIPVGSCGVNPQDAATAECFRNAQDKTVVAIDKVCTVERPACYPSFSGLLFTGLATSTMSSQQPSTYCGFPSAAFRD